MRKYLNENLVKFDLDDRKYSILLRIKKNTSNEACKIIMDELNSSGWNVKIIDKGETVNCCGSIIIIPETWSISKKY